MLAHTCREHRICGIPINKLAKTPHRDLEPIQPKTAHRCRSIRVIAAVVGAARNHNRGTTMLIFQRSAIRSQLLTAPGRADLVEAFRSEAIVFGGARLPYFAPADSLAIARLGCPGTHRHGVLVVSISRDIDARADRSHEVAGFAGLGARHIATNAIRAMLAGTLRFIRAHAAILQPAATPTPTPTSRSTCTFRRRINGRFNAGQLRASAENENRCQPSPLYSFHETHPHFPFTSRMNRKPSRDTPSTLLLAVHRIPPKSAFKIVRAK